jgi:hypothetical protein
MQQQQHEQEREGLVFVKENYTREDVRGQKGRGRKKGDGDCGNARGKS